MVLGRKEDIYSYGRHIHHTLYTLYTLYTTYAAMVDSVPNRRCAVLIAAVASMSTRGMTAVSRKEARERMAKGRNLGDIRGYRGIEELV